MEIEDDNKIDYQAKQLVRCEVYSVVVVKRQELSECRLPEDMVEFDAWSSVERSSKISHDARDRELRAGKVFEKMTFAAWLRPWSILMEDVSTHQVHRQLDLMFFRQERSSDDQH